MRYMQYIHYYTLLTPYTLPDLTLRCIMHDSLQCTMHYIAKYTNVQCAFCTLHFTRCALHIAHCTASHGMEWHYIHGNMIFYILHSLSLYLSAMRIIHINPTHAIHPIKPGLQKELHIFDRPCCHNSMFDPRTTVASNTLNQHGGSMRTPLYFTASYGYGASNVWTHFSWNGFRSQNGQNHFPGGSKKFKAGKPNHFLCAISILFINASISFPLKWPFKWPFSLLVRITFRLKHFDEG